MRKHLALFAASTLLACGGPAAPKPPQAAVAVGAVDLEKEAEKVGVTYPKGLLGWARVARPSALIRSSAPWARMSEQAALDAIYNLGGGAPAHLIALDQPVNMVVTAEGNIENFHAAMSFGVTDFEAVKKLMGEEFDVSNLPDGTVHAKHRTAKNAKSDDDGDGDSESHERDPIGCLLHRDATVVCGSDSALAVLDPFLRKVVPGLDARSDVHVETRVGALMDVLSDKVATLTDLLGASSDGGADNEEVRKKASTEALRLYQDMDTVAFDGYLDGDHGRLETSATFRSANSEFARGLTKYGPWDPSPAAQGLSSHAGVSYLTASATGQEFINGWKPLILRALWKDSPKLTDAQKQDISKFFDIMTTFRGLAIGQDPGAYVKLADSATAPRAPAAAKTRFEVGVRQTEGLWMAAGLRTPLPEVKASLDKLFAIPDSSGSKPDKAPASKTGPFKATPLPAGTSFPADCVLMLAKEQVFEPAKDDKPAKKGATRRVQATLDMHLVLVPMGDETWVFAGNDLASLDRAYQAARTGKPLAPVQPGTVNLVSVTPKVLSMQLEKHLADPKGLRALALEADALRAPPVTMQSQVTQVGGLPRMVVRVDLDRQTVETVVDFEKKWRP